MSDDLVKRLRDYAEQWKVSTFPNIADEAADRIEALEAALLKIHEYPMAFDARQILLKALGEKKDD